MKLDPYKIGGDIVACGLILIVVGVPLAYTTGIFDFALLPKHLVLSLGVGVAAVGWLLRAISGKQTVPRSPVLLPLVAFSAWSLVSFPNTTHPLDSLHEILYQTTLIGIFFLSFCALPGHRVRWVLAAGAMVSLPISVLGILQYLDLSPFRIPSSGHPSATFGYRNFAAMYLVCVIPLSGLGACLSPNRITRMLFAAAATTGVVFLIYTRTRGAWVGAAGGLAVIALLWGIDTRLRRTLKEGLQAASRSRFRILAPACAIGLLILSVLPPRFVDTGLQRFDEKKADISTALTSIVSQRGDRGRRAMWSNTLGLIADNPVTGVGPGGWKRMYPRYDGGAMVRRNSSPRRPHNDFLWIWAETGTLGLALFLWFIFEAFRVLRQLGRDKDLFWQLAAPAFALAVAATLGHSLFSFPREQPQAAVFPYLLIGIAAGRASSVEMRRGRIGLLLAVGLVLSSYGATHLTARWIQFDRHYLRALNLEDQNEWSGVQLEIEQALGMGTFRPHGLFVSGRASEKLGLPGESQSSYARALELEPNSWYIYNGLGILAKKRGHYEEAVRHYRRALDLYPGSDQARINLGALYKEQGDLHRQQGRPELAESSYQQAGLLYRQVHHSFASVHNNLGNLYKAEGKLDSAEVAYHRAIERDSTMVQAHFNLADLYMKTGRAARAVESLTVAARLAPGSSRTTWGLGLALEATGKRALAEVAFGRTVQLDTTHVEAFYKIGNSAFERGDYDMSEVAFRRFLTRWEGDRVYADFARERLEEAKRRQEERARPVDAP